MASLGFPEESQTGVWRLLSGILNLGNVDFDETSTQNVKSSKIKNVSQLDIAAKLFSVDPAVLAKALTTRSISTGTAHMSSDIDILLNEEQAVKARDSLAKFLYNQIFEWVVNSINQSINSSKVGLATGVLDIYGFEVFKQNSFEQFCINFCNEKLQQLFIELVLTQEQEEYLQEGIQWTKVEYFDNGPICELIAGKTMSITRLLDDICTVGHATPRQLLERFDTHLSKHPNYASFVGTKSRDVHKDAFRIKHYAGNVDYAIDNFLEKNSDTVWDSLKEAMQKSTDSLMVTLFPKETLRSNARPLSTSGAFKKDLTELVTKLRSFQPHYIRCIKSNDEKKPLCIDRERVIHQCSYLNLIETVRVRKAGFAARRNLDGFLARYRIVSEEMWPVWTGNDKDGAQKIFDAMKIDQSLYQMGKTKVFVKDAGTLFAIEQRRQERLPMVVTKIQAVWRGYAARKWVERFKDQLFQRLNANIIANAFIRHKLRKFLADCQAKWDSIKDDNLGKNMTFPNAPAYLNPVKQLLEKLHCGYWSLRKVSSLSPENQEKMRQKVLAANIFSGKKPWNWKRDFIADYCNAEDNPQKTEYRQAVQHLFSEGGDKAILFSDCTAKINKRGKAQLRAVILTDKNIYKYEPKKYKMKKDATPVSAVASVHCSSKSDSYVVIKMEAPHRDMVLDFGLSGVEMVSEFVSVLVPTIQVTRNPPDIHSSAQIRSAIC